MKSTVFTVLFFFLPVPFFELPTSAEGNSICDGCRLPAAGIRQFKSA